jgi:hypothetical protein
LKYKRRDALKLLVGTAVLSIIFGDALALVRDVRDQLPAATALRTLNPHQYATVTALAEWIIPQTETPGAKATRVNEWH